ncbi:TRAP transporter small permease [Roseibium marinum]|uniref:TRAP transporter small permease protein n=1 Tax=Roseibium marinum TaxID=281252 RepID=A0A2S3UKJ9_9HYPH|nr:TRAP transporter small permease [Roseibium marinum]POF28019.1 TRAP-type C4-dicarboxylate transport system permease small subunit [Roseibium marinum]
MNRQTEAAAETNDPAAAHTRKRRASRAPDLLQFEDPETDLSSLRWVDGPGILVFWVLAVVVFLQFFTRYVLNDSLAWTEEVARYLLILVCFLGSITATRRGSHITLEFLMRMVPPAAAKGLTVLSQTITLGFFGAMTWIGIELTQKTRQKMISLPIPKAWIYTICVIALGIMAFYSAIWLWRRLRQTPEEVVRSLDAHLPID